MPLKKIIDQFEIKSLYSSKTINNVQENEKVSHRMGKDIRSAAI